MAIRLIKQAAAEAVVIQPLCLAELEAPFAEPEPEGVPDPEPRTTAQSAAIPAGLPGGGEAASEADIAQVERNAFESGFRQGEKAGKEIAEKKMEAVMRRYGDSILELGKAKSALYAQVEREVVKLAVAVARKIVHREIHVDPEVVQTLVRVALSHAAERSVVTIRLNPTDHQFLLEKHPGWEQELGGGQGVVLVADKTIERGGCLIQTDCGDVDARVEERFREVERGFFEGCEQVGQ
ncbi:MAG: hypothetical protein HXY20_10845 [Acidobacteria bacterium]|nr:hypothetical protein [Acidobacteriota bacterium]